MTVKPKPGHHPDPNDMSIPSEEISTTHDVPVTEPELEEEEEVAAKLGDFA